MARPSRLPLSALVELCRTLRHMLGAGLSLLDVFRQQSKRGPTAVRPFADAVARDLGKGHDLEHALEKHRDALPPLFVEMAVAGEQSGGLPEVFAELEKHFRLVQKLRRQLWSQLTWPIFELVMGVLVVSLMLLVLGFLGLKYDPLGLGTGVPGALAFAGLVCGSVGLLVALFFYLRRKPTTEQFLLRQPVVGPCLMALALHRFCVALRLTSGTGMPIARAMRLSLKATGNVTFLEATDAIVRGLEKGEELTRALGRGKIFPSEYLDVMSGAELAGRLDDVLEHQANYYEEEAERRLTALTKMIGYGIWLLIGALLVFLIFRMALSYLSVLNQMT